MSAYVREREREREEEQSEDGELAQSPVRSASGTEASDGEDASPEVDAEGEGELHIQPPQPGHRPLRKRMRHEHQRKRLYRDRERDQIDMRSKRELELAKHAEREYHSKDYYRMKEKEMYREKDMYRTRDFREKEYKEKDLYRESDLYREKDVYREKEPYRSNYREKDVYKEKDHHKEKESYREKDFYREKDAYREKDRVKMSRRHLESDRKASAREESRLRHIEESRIKDSSSRYSEKENRGKVSGDKELEDLRSRLLSKRQSKEQQDGSRKRDDRMDMSPVREPPRSSRLPELSKDQLERRDKLLKIERETSHQKKISRAALAARREKLKEDEAKRMNASPPVSHKKRKHHSRPTSPSPTSDDIVMVSDASDVDMKSDVSQHSEKSEDGTASSTESTSGTTEDEDTESEKTEEEEEDNENEDLVNHKHKKKVKKDNKDKPNEGRTTQPPTPEHIEPSPTSTHSVTPPNRDEISQSPSPVRSRSNSFSPPPLDGNGTSTEPVPEEPPEPSPPPTPVDDTPELPPFYPALQGCRSVEEFQCLNRIEEGTYGVVYRAKDKTTDEIVALKRLKMEKEKEGFPITSLREINTLLKGQHPNIVTVREIVVGSNMDKIFIVMDYVEHDLKGLMETMRARKQFFLPGEVKCLMQQLLRAVNHLHDNWILHRDLKTSNLLLSHKGVLKVGDFGLAREYGSPLKPYTPIVVTLWYRAPELLLGTKLYSTPIDVWSVGCIFAEFLTMNPLFPGKSDVDQLNRIFKELGTPNDTIWPGWSLLTGSRATWAEHPGGGLRKRVNKHGPTCLELLEKLLTYDPKKRTTAAQALTHTYFSEQPLAIDPAMFPTWPAKSEGGRRHQNSPKPPSGGDQYKMLRDEDQAVGFHMGTIAPAMAPFHPPVNTGFSLKF